MNRSSRAMGWCPDHGKLLYTDRKIARRAAKEHHEHKNEYPCPTRQGMWHIGALPRRVIDGDMTRDEYYGSAS